MGSATPRIRESGADVVAIAVSATYSQMAFSNQLGIDFPLLSDWDGTVSGAYGVRYKTWKGHTGLAKRALFLIDDDGIVQYAWHTDDAETLPDLAPVLTAVKTATA